jgi:type II secretory pathway pseudopilin PulG
MVSPVVKAKTPISIIGKLSNLSLICHGPRRLPSVGGQGGFTLMELLVVCILSLMFLSLGIPSFRNAIYVDQLDSTARKIIGTIKELRTMAASQQKPYLLHIDFDEHRIWYEIDETKNPLADEPKTGFSLSEDVKIDDVQTRTQGKQNSGRVTLWITSKGYMDQTALHLRRDQELLTLLFSPFSSEARIYEDYVEFDT